MGDRPGHEPIAEDVTGPRLRPPRLEAFEAALVLPTTRVWTPPGMRNARRDGGACDSAGRPIAHAVQFGDHTINEPGPPGAAPPASRLDGTWLYGGMLRDHFGHFVTETVGRLWGWRESGLAFDGIVFIPYVEDRPPSHGEAQDLARRAFVADMLDLLGIGTRLVVATEPTRVERLVVPEQIMFDWEERQTVGLGPLRRLFRSMLDRVAGVPGLGADVAYVSRAGRPGARFIAEDAIEEAFLRAGHAVMRPETMPLRDQVAAYRDLHGVVFAEGSAMHLALPLLRAGARVGVIWRGWKPLPRLVRQMRRCGFADAPGIAPARGFVGAVRPDGGSNIRFSAVLPDYARLGRWMVGQGFLPAEAWRDPDEERIAAGVAQAFAKPTRTGLARQWFPRPGDP
jgi:hypothetical protein